MIQTISFKPFLVDQIRRGVKNRTRRLLHPQPVPIAHKMPPIPCPADKYANALKKASKEGFTHIYTNGNLAGMMGPRFPFGEEPGAVLKIKEEHRIVGYDQRKPNKLEPFKPLVDVEFRDGYTHTVEVSPETLAKIEKRKTNGKWRGPRFMFTEFARTEIYIVSHHPERLSNITECEAIGEGVEAVPGGWKNYAEPEKVCETARDSFFSLFAMIHGIDVVINNPFVWAIDFLLVESVDLGALKPFTHEDFKGGHI